MQAPLCIGLATPELLEIYTGSAVSIFQCRRWLMSLLEQIYAEPRGALRRAVLPMSRRLKDESLSICASLTQAFMDFRSPLSLPAMPLPRPRLCCECTARPFSVQRELRRHGLQKSLWSRLLQPSGALLRERGQLPDDDQLPSGTYVSHPLWETTSKCLCFKQFGGVRRCA